MVQELWWLSLESWFDHHDQCIVTTCFPNFDWIVTLPLINIQLGQNLHKTVPQFSEGGLRWERGGISQRALVHGGDTALLGCWTFLLKEGGQCGGARHYYVGIALEYKLLVYKSKFWNQLEFCHLVHEIKGDVCSAKKAVVVVILSAKAQMCWCFRLMWFCLLWAPVPGKYAQHKKVKHPLAHSFNIALECSF